LLGSLLATDQVELLFLFVAQRAVEVIELSAFLTDASMVSSRIEIALKRAGGVAGMLTGQAFASSSAALRTFAARAYVAQ
jgi:hypothetical protein